MCKHNRLIEVQYNDINAQRTNVYGLMKWRNIKLSAVGHYFATQYHKQRTVGEQNTSGMPCINLVFCYPHSCAIA